ncbi:MAG: EcsC family protein [Polyangiaceae bacterium]|nr:EcsC family protein [Polyangiaceae bacterium]
MQQPNEHSDAAPKPAEASGPNPGKAGASASSSAVESQIPTPTHAPWERWLSRTAEGFASFGLEALHATVLKTLRPGRVYAAFEREGAKVEGPADIAALDAAVVERVARRVRTKYGIVAATGGVGTGAFGLVGWVAELPFLATLSLRAASELALVYGADPSAPAESRRLRKLIADARLAPGNEGPSTGELAALGVSTAQKYYRDGAMAGLGFPIAKRAMRTIVQRWGAPRVARALPWVGGAVGAAMGAWYIGRVLDAVGAHYRAQRAADGAATATTAAAGAGASP